MAFSIVNKAFAPPEGSYLPAAHRESEITLVNSAYDSGAIDTGIAALKFMRVRWVLKTLGGQAGGETIRISIQAGTGAAATNPVQIGQQAATMETGDTGLSGEFMCWSNALFQSYEILINSSGSARVPVIDVMIDCV